MVGDCYLQKKEESGLWAHCVGSVKPLLPIAAVRSASAKDTFEWSGLVVSERGAWFQLALTYLLCRGGEISKLGIAGSCNDINTKYNRKSTLLCQQARQTQLKDLFPHCCWQSLNHIQTLCDCISVFLWEKKGQIDTGCGVNSWQVNNKVVRHQERRGLKEQLTKLYVYKDETKLSLDYCMHLKSTLPLCLTPKCACRCS